MLKNLLLIICLSVSLSAIAAPTTTTKETPQPVAKKSQHHAAKKTHPTNMSKPSDKAVIDDAKVQAFIKMMVKDHKFNQTDLEHLFKQVQWQKAILTSVHHPKEALNWHQYSNLFVTQRRIENGVDFWKKHKKVLNQVSKQYGVPPEIIVALLGVETKYGTRQGNHRVIDSLTTIAFNFPKRSKFFTQELAEFLILCRDNHLNPLKMKGSYAGAFGMPQFMPSSYRRYAVDYSHNGKKDLSHDYKDAIASVANYLKKNGWQANQPVAVAANVKGYRYKKYLYKGKHHHIHKPNITVKVLEKNGITPKKTVPTNDKAILLKLAAGGDQYEYWLGFTNFYVIMRYNPSQNYAMAVYTLADLIKDQLENQNS